MTTTQPVRARSRARSGGVRAVWERSLLVQRRTWLAVVAGFGEPVLYLAALGLGFGALAGTVAGPGGVALSYPAYVAPALLACSAMNGALFESVYTVYYKLSYLRLYVTMLATQLGPPEVVLGEIAWAAARGTVYGGLFLVVMLAAGLVTSWWALLVLPATLLVALAFAAAGMAAATYLRGYQDFELVNLVVLPMFLFSTTFSPLTAYPAAARHVIEALPLYQGVALIRSLVTGHVGPADLGHVAYLVAMTALGVVVTIHRLRPRVQR
jgi:lipooligosaccharide transport system permease protein